VKVAKHENLASDNKKGESCKTRKFSKW